MWLLVLVAFSALAQQPEPAYVEGVKLHQSGDHGAAIAKYREVLDRNPAHLGARSNLGAALAATGRYDEAIGEYRLALKQSDHPAIRRNLALAYYKSGRLGEASEELARLLRSEPRDLNLALLLGDCHFRLGDNEKVIEVLQPLEARQAENPGLAYLLGTAYIRAGRVADGQKLVDKILSRGDSAEAHMMLGEARMRAGDVDAAAAEFERAVAIRPDLPAAWSRLGDARLKRNDHAGAAEAFRKELSLNPTDFDANLYLGVILRETARAGEALPLIERATRIQPGSAKARYQLGSLYLQLNRPEEARSVLEKLVAEAPSFPEAHVSLATAYLRLGRKEEAARHRERARELMTGSGKPD